MAASEGSSSTSSSSSSRIEKNVKTSVSNRSIEKQADHSNELTLRHYPGYIKWLATAVTIITGVYCVYAFKWQGYQYVPKCEDCEPEQFKGSLVQTQIMFMGECLGLLTWYIDTLVNKPKGRANITDFETSDAEFGRPYGHWYYWILSSFLDFAATYLCNIALTMTYAATVQMLRNFNVVLAALLTLVMIRRALRVHEWIGVVGITGAMVLAALPAFSDPDPSVTGNRSAIGIVLALAGTSVQAVQLLTEEFFFRKGRYSPLKAIGCEGVAGLVFSFIAWPIMQATKFEDVTGSWYQQVHSGKLSLIMCLYIPAVILFNGAGLACVKLGGGLLRAVCFAVRAPLVWLFGLASKWQTFDYYNLGSMILFVIAFAFYCNCLFAKVDGPFDLKMRKPIHFCCTRRELDDDYVPPEEAPIAIEEKV